MSGESSALNKSANAPDDASHEITIPAPPVFRPADADLDKLAGMVEAAKKVAIFGGDGCRDARDEVLQLADKLKAPVGYSFLSVLGIIFRATTSRKSRSIETRNISGGVRPLIT
jgi:thiamine pyrophosphate-dependent acetolactate synthase large subunit-like protein